MTRTIAAALVFAAALLLPARAPTQPLASYETFGATTLDPTRWRSYEHSVLGAWWPGGTIHDAPRDMSPGGPDWGMAINAERRLAVADGRLRLALTTWGQRVFDRDWRAMALGRLGVRLNDAALADRQPSVRALQATATLVSMTETRQCTPGFSSSGRAGVHAVFFNDQSAYDQPVGRRGDVIARLELVAEPGRTSLAIVATVWMCDDAVCDALRPAAAFSPSTPVAFTRTVDFGEAIPLLIRWQPGQRRFVFTAGSGETRETKTVSYSETVSPLPPVGYVYDLRVENQPGACTGTGPVWWEAFPRVLLSTEARFDNVRLNANAIEDSRSR